MQSAADFATRPRPPTRLGALARRPVTSNREPRAGEASTPLTALPITPRAHLRRARERASFDGGGSSTPPLTQLVDSPLSQLHSSGTGRARANDRDGLGQVPSGSSVSAAQVDQAAHRLESTTTPEATSAKTESQQTASEPGECTSDLGGQPRDSRVPTMSAAVPTPSTELTRSPDEADDLEPTGRVSGSTASPETLVEAIDGPTGAKGPYGSLTRDDLEYLLSEADRVIREKEQGEYTRWITRESLHQRVSRGGTFWKNSGALDLCPLFSQSSRLSLLQVKVRSASLITAMMQCVRY